MAALNGNILILKLNGASVAAVKSNDVETASGLMEVASGAMRGFGKSIAPMIVSLLGSCVFRIVWVYTVFAANPTLPVLYISYPLSWTVTGAVHYLCCFHALRGQKKEA
jgi:Na+-driven multidrug efflux pump